MNSKKVRTYQSVTTPIDSLYFHFLWTKLPSCGCHMTSDVQSYWLALCSVRSIVYAWCPTWNFEFAAVSSFNTQISQLEFMDSEMSECN